MEGFCKDKVRAHPDVKRFYNKLERTELERREKREEKRRASLGGERSRRLSMSSHVSTSFASDNFALNDLLPTNNEW